MGILTQVDKGKLPGEYNLMVILGFRMYREYFGNYPRLCHKIDSSPLLEKCFMDFVAILYNRGI